MRGMSPRLCAVLLAASAVAQTHQPMRGVLETPGGELPFIMSAVLGPFRIYHGDHWQPVNWRRTSGNGSPYSIDFAPYDSVLEHGEGEYSAQIGSVYRGTWTKVGASGPVTMPFRWESWPLLVDPTDPGRRFNAPMFAIAGEPWDATGRWRVQFEKDAQPAVLLIEPSRNEWIRGPGEIQGTVLTTTGDYRWLAGTARGDELRLACFDGAHAFLFVAKRQKDGSLTGTFWSGASWQEAWVARRDDKAQLPDAFGMTKVKEGVALGALEYPDAASGKQQRLDSLFGRVTLVTLFGTWCPNCGDAGPFLRELQQRFGDRGLRLIGLAFEHGDDVERHRRVVAEYRKVHETTWPILLAGPSDKAKASEAFAVLDAVRSFPTTLFVDHEGVVRAVHQGFAGPATGAAHEQQKQAFVSRIERLLGAAEQAPNKR